MNKVKSVYSGIKKYSRVLIASGDEWARELGSSKNFIASPDLKHWTFGKSVGKDGEYHDNGGVAKEYLYRLGFVNVLSLPNKALKNKYIEAFLLWAEKIRGYQLSEKFQKDQAGKKRFELLIHISELSPPKISTKDGGDGSLLTEFDEGFKKQIAIEVSYRDPKLTALAKRKYGTGCAVCGFNFGVHYGPYGEGFVEIHHLFPIAKGSRITKLEDVRPVCSNCHRMLHRGEQLLSIEELKAIIKKNKREKRHNSLTSHNKLNEH